MNKFFKKAIHEKAKHFYSVLLPSDISRGKTGNCFDHCVIEAMKSNGKYLYVEGLAFIDGKWIYHAWLTDKNKVCAYDPTWGVVNERVGIINMKLPVNYLGVVMEVDKVIDFMQKTKYKAVLKNYWRAKNLAKEIYDTAL